MTLTALDESPFGVHRVAAPAGVLPYQAQRLELDSPLRAHEVRIAVEKLNLDSASFYQLKQETGGDMEALKARVAAIVAERGKMHNPVTGSGGVLIGRVSEVGAARHDVKVGDRVITLVSLTTTPLRLTALGEVIPAAHQLHATGEAILFARSPFGHLPADMDEDLVLSVLDVAGAPAQAHRLAKPGMTVAVLGAGGRSGLLCSWIAAAQVGPTGRVIALEYSEAGLAKLARVPGPVTIQRVDATDALAVRQAVEEATGGALADLAINCVNVPGTEMASILAVRPRGMVYFFSMATSFQAAALGAEAVGQDVDLLMGNGYAEDHAAYALQVVRENPVLAELVR
ncbi:MAG: L-erythro-3,5-diaminohexanoate dehydrogenase [Candidatus Sericytochromatia bacterium]|nr:L-erythro-3,5-diaminohexanoate dehydrogenase [Candidatus Sericytochromatia bacterium]